MAVTINVIGDKELSRKLEKAAKRFLPKSKHRKLLRKGAEVLRDGMRSTVKSEPFQSKGAFKATGNLSRSVKTFSFTRSRKYHIGPRVGKHEGVRGEGSKLRNYEARLTSTRRTADGWYFGFQDKGTTGKKGKPGGSIRARMMTRKTASRYGGAAARRAARDIYQDLKYLI